MLCQQIASTVGTFGRVLECWDRQTREYVAIKVVRSMRKYRDAAMIEVEVLQHIAKNDRGGSRYVYLFSTEREVTGLFHDLLRLYLLTFVHVSSFVQVCTDPELV